MRFMNILTLISSAKGVPLFGNKKCIQIFAVLLHHIAKCMRKRAINIVNVSNSQPWYSYTLYSYKKDV